MAFLRQTKAMSSVDEPIAMNLEIKYRSCQIINDVLWFLIIILIIVVRLLKGVEDAGFTLNTKDTEIKRYGYG